MKCNTQGSIPRVDNTRPTTAVPQAPTTGAGNESSFVVSRGTCREPLHVPVSRKQTGAGAHYYGVRTGIVVQDVGEKHKFHMKIIRLDFGSSYCFRGARASAMQSSGVFTSVNTWSNNNPGMSYSGLRRLLVRSAT